MDNRTYEQNKALLARQATERAIVLHLLTTARAAGWPLAYVNDGGDEAVRCHSDEEGMAAIFAVDDCTACFRAVKPTDRGTKHPVCGVYIVLGNGIDCIADYHAYEPFTSAVMDASDAYIDKLGEESTS